MVKCLMTSGHQRNHSLVAAVIARVPLPASPLSRPCVSVSHLCSVVLSVNLQLLNLCTSTHQKKYIIFGIIGEFFNPIKEIVNIVIVILQNDVIYR